MRLPHWLLRLLPIWDYICPQCHREVKPNSHKCPHCGERFPFPVRVPPKCLKSREELERYVHEKIFPKLSPLQREYLAKYFTTIFSDGFESGDFSAWSSTAVGGSGSSLTVQSSVKHHGTYAVASHVEATGGYANFYKEFASSYDELYVRAYIRLTNLPSSAGALVYVGPAMEVGDVDYLSLEIAYPAANVQWCLWFHDGGDIRLYSPTPTINVDTWYCVEIYYKKGSGNGIGRLYVNGSLVIEKTDATLPVSINKIGLGAWNDRGNTNTTVYIDCVVVADTYIGPEAELILKQWSQTGITSHSLRRQYRTMKLAQNLNTSHIFSRPFRSLKLTHVLNLTHVFLHHCYMKFSQVLGTLHTWAVFVHAEIIKQWFTSIQLTHTFKRPERKIRYTQALIPNQVFRRSLRIIKLPVAIQLTHTFSTPSRMVFWLKRLGLLHEHCVVVPSVKKTRVFLVLGDLAIQILGD